MRLSSRLWTALFTLATVMAWATTASLFFILKRAPLTRGALMDIYYPTLSSLLPWLSGWVFWIKIRKRARLPGADRDTAGVCHMMIVATLGAAYVAVFSIEIVLLSVLVRAK